MEANWTVESGAWTSGDLTATVTGLKVGTQYDVQVRAENAAGEGPWSASRTGTTALSDDATLGALTLTGVRLSPAFSSGVTSYTASVGYTVMQVTIAATTSDGNAASEFLDGSGNTRTDAAGAAGFQVDLSAGENVIRVEVTAQDGLATETYSVTVTRTEQDLSLTPPASDPCRAVRLDGHLHHPVPRPLDDDCHAGRPTRRRALLTPDRRGAQRWRHLPRERGDGQPGCRVDGGDRGHVEPPGRGQRCAERRPARRPLGP